MSHDVVIWIKAAEHKEIGMYLLLLKPLDFPTAVKAVTRNYNLRIKLRPEMLALFKGPWFNHRSS
jgi:hypothetical protein